MNFNNIAYPCKDLKTNQGSAYVKTNSRELYCYL